MFRVQVTIEVMVRVRFACTGSGTRLTAGFSGTVSQQYSLAPTTVVTQTFVPAPIISVDTKGLESQAAIGACDPWCVVAGTRWTQLVACGGHHRGTPTACVVS